MIKLGTWLTRDNKAVFLWYDRYNDGSEYCGIFYDDTQNSTWDENGKNYLYSELDLVTFICPLPQEFIKGEINSFDAMYPVE